jgi:uncharacterized Zn-finger protein
VLGGGNKDASKHARILSVSTLRNQLEHPEVFLSWPGSDEDDDFISCSTDDSGF